MDAAQLASLDETQFFELKTFARIIIHDDVLNFVSIRRLF